MDKVVTLRDIDWQYVQEFFHLPNNPEEVDIAPITLKSINSTSPENSKKTAIQQSECCSQSRLF